MKKEARKDGKKSAASKNSRVSRRQGSAGRADSANARSGEGGELHQQAGKKNQTMTTSQGVPVSDDQNSLRVGARGPGLLEDVHFREKLFHFDHERIPERVVHARGFGAHGYFENYKSLKNLTSADIFQRAGEKALVYTHFAW